MATPPNASTAKSSSDTANTALTDAANQAFINDIVTAIANAEGLGVDQVFLTAQPEVDYNYVAKYMQGLGYQVTFPDFPISMDLQPADLFGPAWIDYWTNNLIPNQIPPNTPIRMGFFWVTPTA